MNVRVGTDIPEGGTKRVTLRSDRVGTDISKGGFDSKEKWTGKRVDWTILH